MSDSGPPPTEEKWAVADKSSMPNAPMPNNVTAATSEPPAQIEPHSAKETPRKIGYFELYRFATTFDKALMAVGLLMAAAAGSANPLLTIVFGNLVNSFSAPQPIVNGTAAEFEFRLHTFQDNLMSQVRENCLYFVYIALATFVTTYIYMAIFVSCGERITHHTRHAYLKAVLRQNIGWHDTEGAGEVATRITSDMLLIQEAISEKVPICFSQVFAFISAFIIAFIKSWRLTLVLMCGIPLIAGSVVIMNKVSSKYQTVILEGYSKAGTIAEEGLTAVRTVTAFNAQKKMSQRYGDLLATARNAGVRKAMVTGLGTGVMFGVIYLMYSVSFYYGSVLLLSDLIDAGTVVNVFFAVLIGAFSLAQVAPELQAIALGTGAGSKIFFTLERVPAIDTEDKGGKTIDQVAGKVEFKNVQFTYPSRPDVKILKGLDLTVEPGKTVALVGASGSGKSTIIQLLERFYDSTDGEVLFDGVNVKDLNLLWLRRQIGYVSQEPTLFEGSVAENIAHGLTGTANEHANEETKLKLIQSAAVKANAHEFIQLLPQGYNTQVGERGLLLSGGQKQRIAIARAIIKDPKVLLLDEATSALDTTSERIVQAALENASEGRTTIVIAHRLSTIKNADLIVVMARGEIIEKGTHQELIEMEGGFYAQLVNAQQLVQNEDNGQDVSDVRETLTERKEDTKKSEFIVADSIKPETVTERTGTADAEMGFKDSERPITLGHVIVEIYKLNKPELIYICVGLVASVAAGLVVPFLSIIFSSAIGAFSEPEPQRTTDAHFWAGLFVALAAVTAVSNFIQNFMFGLSNEFLTERIRKLLYTKMLRQNIAFFDQDGNTTGALTSSLATDAQKVQGASGVTLGTALQLFFTLFGGVVVGLVYGWKLALLGLCLVPVLVATSFFRLRVLKYFHDKVKKAYARSAQVATESVAAIRTVQSLTNEQKVLDGYSKLLDGPLRDGYKNAAFNTILYAAAQCTNFFGNAACFYYGGYLVAYEGYTVKTFFTVFMAVIFGSMSAGRIFAFVPDAFNAKNSAENILRIVEREPEIDSDSSEGLSVDSTNVQGLVEFKDVKFVYPTRPNVKVLRGLNISVKPGQFVALVGPSGCGKSTTIGLIERFYDPIDGFVCLDGNDIRKLNINQYRNVVGLVSQEPNLFDMSIEDNIAFGCDEQPSEERIIQAAKDANIHDFIMSLPDGYKTFVGQKGGQLSGGQKQRVAIARALVRNPRVLLLDEATSALDAESEKIVQLALDEAAKGRTTIAIAHRLSSIQHADVIYFLKDGVVAESGTHQQLYDKRGMYYELVVQQGLDGQKSEE
ncbi:GTPase-activating protein [Rhizoclosmatium sp. JEL0117]|nr:GTPase-activating protein [Rhizoclosmatium sp. JEL0117]